MTQRFAAQGGGTPHERTCIVGLGKMGCAIISRLSSRNLAGPALAAVHTDAKMLSECPATTKLQIGKRATLGLGSGGDPDIGRRAAEDDIDLLRGLFSGKDVVFVVAGLGGGTGTGGAPVLIGAAQDAGALTICLASMPFQFEGTGRRNRAEKGLQELAAAADMTIVIRNEHLFGADDNRVSLQAAFDKVADALDTGIFGLWKLVSRDGFINVDYADLRNFTKDRAQPCLLGYGHATGADKAAAAVEAALKNPLLGAENVAGAHSLLVSIVGGPGLTLAEVNQIMGGVTAASRGEVHVYMGASVEEEMGDGLLVAVIAPVAGSGSAAPVAEEASAAAGQPGEPAKKKKSRSKTTQGDLALGALNKGRFKDVDPTIFDGEDMDIPTFVRRNIAIEK